MNRLRLPERLSGGVPFQLIAGCLAVAVLATGCNRQDADATADRAAAEMRSAADSAGKQLADGWITTKIQAQYFADDDVKARYIEVSTEDRLVTLRGTVDTPAAKDVALQIARNTDGVRDIRDQLAVVSQGAAAQAPASPAASADETLGTQVREKLSADAAVKTGTD